MLESGAYPSTMDSKGDFTRLSETPTLKRNSRSNGNLQSLHLASRPSMGMNTDGGSPRNSTLSPLLRPSTSRRSIQPPRWSPSPWAVVPQATSPDAQDSPAAAYWSGAAQASSIFGGPATSIHEHRISSGAGYASDRSIRGAVGQYLGGTGKCTPFHEVIGGLQKAAGGAKGPDAGLIPGFRHAMTRQSVGYSPSPRASHFGPRDSIVGSPGIGNGNDSRTPTGTASDHQIHRERGLGPDYPGSGIYTGRPARTTGGYDSSTTGEAPLNLKRSRLSNMGVATSMAHCVEPSQVMGNSQPPRVIDDAAEAVTPNLIGAGPNGAFAAPIEHQVSGAGSQLAQRLSVAPIDTALPSDAAEPAPVSGQSSKILISPDTAQRAPYSDRPPLHRGWFSPRVAPVIQAHHASVADRGFLSANVAAAGSLKTRSTSLKLLMRRALKPSDGRARIPVSGAMPGSSTVEAVTSPIDLGTHAVSDTGLVTYRSGAGQSSKDLVSTRDNWGVYASTAAAKPAGRRVWQRLVSYVSGGNRARAQSQNI